MTNVSRSASQPKSQQAKRKMYKKGGPGNVFICWASKETAPPEFRADDQTDIKQITAAQVNANIEVFFFSLNNT